MRAGRRFREERLDLQGGEVVAEGRQVALVVEGDLVEGQALGPVALAQVHHGDSLEERRPAEGLEQGRAATEGRLVGVEDDEQPRACGRRDLVRCGG